MFLVKSRTLFTNCSCSRAVLREPVQIWAVFQQMSCRVLLALPQGVVTHWETTGTLLSVRYMTSRQTCRYSSVWKHTFCQHEQWKQQKQITQQCSAIPILCISLTEFGDRVWNYMFQWQHCKGLSRGCNHLNSHYLETWHKKAGQEV